MKTQAIEMGVTLLATGGKEAAEAAWEKMKAGLFAGQEPTDAALKHFDADDLRGAGVDAVFAKPWAKLFAGSATPTVDDRFKPKKASSYTPHDLVRLYAANDSDPALNDEIDGRTMEPWVIAVESKVIIEESAKFLAWNIAGDEPPRAVKVNGVRVAPVKRGMEKAAKRHAEDPSAPGARLPVDGISKVTGCDFSTMTLPCRKLFRVALSYELRGVGVLTMRDYARRMSSPTAKPETFEEALTDAFEAYKRMESAGSLPDLEIQEGYEGPPRVLRDGGPRFDVTSAADGARAGSPSAPLVYVVAGSSPPTLDLMRSHLSTQIRTNTIRFDADRNLPAGHDSIAWSKAKCAEADVIVMVVTANNLCSATFMEIVEHVFAMGNKTVVPVIAGQVSLLGTPFSGRIVLPRSGRLLTSDAEGAAFSEEIRGIVKRILAAKKDVAPDTDEIYRAVINAGAGRSGLLIGINPHLVAGLPVLDSPGSTILSDLHQLRSVGGDAWRTWLQNAERAAGPRVESAVFRRALAAL